MKNVLIIAPVTLLALAVSSLHAETWNASSGNAFWGDSASWTPASVPNATGATATFNAGTASGRTATLGGTGSTCPVGGCNFTVGAINLTNTSSFTTTIRNDGSSTAG